MNDNNNEEKKEPEEVIPEVLEANGRRVRKSNSVVYGAPGNTMSIISLVASGLSLFITTIAVPFAWSFHIGFIMNIMSLICGLAGLLLAILSKKRRTQAGVPKSLFTILTIVAAIAALLFGSFLLSCTSRAACFYCVSQQVINSRTDTPSPNTPVSGTPDVSNVKE